MSRSLQAVHSLRRHLRQHALTSVWVLAFAMLLAIGWGQVHRVLHPGAVTLASVEVGVQTGQQNAEGALAHDDGGSLCRLLDHLSQGAGPVQALPVCPVCAPPVEVPVLRWSGAQALAARGFDARAPPRLA